LARFVQSFPDSAYTPDATSRLREITLASTDTGRTVVIDGETIESDAVATVLDLRGKLPKRGNYEPDSSIPAELFEVWPSPLPETPGGLGELVTDCDLVASDPDDQQRVGPGVDWGLVNVRRAVRTCGYALARDPDNARLAFQLARVLDIGAAYPWARYFYTAAAQAGYAAAMTNLGYMAIEGRGGEINYPAAAAWYRRAATLGNLRARTNIGEIYLKGQGLPPNFEEAILWYRLASSMGWPNAQNALADMYRKGQGVEKDERASAALYLLAAENGQREAMNSLGRSYLNGWGVEKNRDAAHLWLNRATDSGDRYAPYFLARDLAAVSEGAEDPQKVIDLLQLSADRGFRDSYLELSRTYADGKITPADPVASFFWARIAQIAGVEGAEKLVAESGAMIDDRQKTDIEKLIANRRALNGF
jgi:TPR repeat protein